MSVDVLLDTNMLLWLARGDERARWLGPIIDADDCTVTISAASLTEVAIKRSIGKLPDDVAQLRAMGRTLGCLELDFGANHAERLGLMPLHHRDPFDRMLIAQAMVEHLAVATSDRSFAQYDGVRVLNGR